MNAEQLARDIKSLDQAHRELDKVIAETAAPIGRKAATAVSNYLSLKAEQGVLEKLHREFDRAEPRYLGGVIERARRAVDELLKLRQQGSEAAGNIYDLNKQLEALKAKQGETNNSRLEEEDRLEIREKLITALGCGRFTPTVAMVDQVLEELQQTRDRAATISYFQQSRGAANETQVHMMREALKVRESELAELQQKHQELYSNYKLLQALSIGQPKGLAPKEKWGVYPIGQGSYRVMRGNEDATPHPVSKGIAEAIAGELNAR